MINKKTIIFSIIGVILFIIAVFTVSYAYFSTNIEESGNNKTVEGKTAKLSAKFEDGEFIEIENMIPGNHFSKTFSVENNGMDMSYKIVVNELINEFESYGDITYVLKENDAIIKEGTFPKEIANNEISDTRTIKNGERKNYTITITYQNTEEDQTSDMGKTISGKLFVKEL